MINALKSLGHNQFEFARWAPEQYDRYKIIQVEMINEDAARFSTVLQNLMTVEDSIIVRTGYMYDYKPRQHLFYRNKWWEIISVQELTQDVNPQALGLVNCGYMQYALEIKVANGYDVK